MPIPLGVLAVAGAGGGGAAGNAYELLETQVLGSAAASVDFTGLGTYASTYQHLQLRISNKSASTNSQVFLTFNNDSGNNYSFHEMIGTGSAVESYASTSQPRIQAWQLPPTTGFTGAVMDILDPFETTKNKTTRSFGGQAESTYNQIRLGSGLWMNTASVTSIKLTGGVNIAAGSRFSLYGMRSS
jgi:hypothetical protein